MSDMLSSLFDSSVDDLKDLPVFKAVVPGTYRAQFNWETVTDGDLPYLKFQWKLIELLEQADSKQEPEDLAKEGGRKVVINAFPLKKNKTSGDTEANAFGEGTIKMIVKSLSETFPGANTGEILNNGNGCMVGVTFGIEKKKDKDTGEVRENSKLISMVVES